MLAPSFDGSVGLIRHAEPNYSSWLARWNVQSECFEFIVAARLERESYRACLSREIAWLLNLERDRDYLISSVARLHYEKNDMKVEFFVVDPYGKSFAKKIKSDPDNRWLRRHELEKRHTDDGLAISVGLCELLFAADVLPHDFHI